MRRIYVAREWDYGLYWSFSPIQMKESGSIEAPGANQVIFSASEEVIGGILNRSILRGKVICIELPDTFNTIIEREHGWYFTNLKDLDDDDTPLPRHWDGNTWCLNRQIGLRKYSDIEITVVTNNKISTDMFPHLKEMEV